MSLDLNSLTKAQLIELLAKVEDTPKTGANYSANDCKTLALETSRAKYFTVAKLPEHEEKFLKGCATSGSRHLHSAFSSSSQNAYLKVAKEGSEVTFYKRSNRQANFYKAS